MNFQHMCRISLFVLLILSSRGLAQDNVMAESFSASLENGAIPEILSTFPVSINRVSEEQLHAIQILDAQQIRSLLAYRNRFGLIISKYELQLITGITPAIIRKLEEFIIFDEISFNDPISTRIKSRIEPVEVTSLFRLRKKDRQTEISNRHRIRIEVPGRYIFDLRTDHDDGEPWRLNPPDQFGFDHVSASMSASFRGNLKTIVAGNFRVHAGQGLVQNAAFRMGKGAGLPLPALSCYIVPSGTFGESGRLTGAAGQFSLRNWNSGFYISHRAADASIHEDGSFTALSTSGIHRSIAEIRNRNAISISSSGGFAEYSWKQGLLGTAFNFDRVSHPLRHTAGYKTVLPGGKNFVQGSLFGNYRYRNLIAWFEFAMLPSMSAAVLAGTSLALDRHIEALLIIRKYSPGYFSFYGNAFGEQSSVNRNEEGLYFSLAYLPRKKWRISAYADLYRFPWYTYRRNSGLAGVDYRLDGEFRIGQYRIRGFFRTEWQSTTAGHDGLMSRRNRFQLHLTKTYGLASEIRMRLQMNQYILAANESGYLASADYILNTKKVQWNLRLMYFNTMNYQTREFISERDVWGAFSLPSYYGTGFRTVFLTRIKFSPAITAWLRYAVTFKLNETIDQELKVQTKFMI